MNSLISYSPTPRVSSAELGSFHSLFVILGGIALLLSLEVSAQMVDEYLEYLYNTYGDQVPINEYDNYNDYLNAGNDPVEVLETGSIPLFFDDPPTCEAEDQSRFFWYTVRRYD